MDRISEFKALLAQPKNIVIVTHFKPDADALGSTLGLAGYLRRKGHQVHPITPSDYPGFLAWMPGHETVHAVQKDKPETLQHARHLIGRADVIFCLDFSSLKRIEDLESPVREASAVKVMVDHHLEPDNFAQFSYWDVKCASTAQMIYELIVMLGERDLIDNHIANCLYAGLMTDTGNFRHNNVTAREFQVAADLTALGANPSEVARQIYDTNSVERLRLTGFVLSQRMHVLPEYNTVYMTLTAEEMRQHGSQTGDTEGLVNYGLSIKGIKMSVLMYDRKDEIKFSFRSLGDFSVNDLARKHFQGGGHRNAAGGSSKQSLQEALQHFLSILPEYKDALRKPI